MEVVFKISVFVFMILISFTVFTLNKSFENCLRIPDGYKVEIRNVSGLGWVDGDGNGVKEIKFLIVSEKTK